MRSINTLEWHTGPTGSSLKSISLDNALPLRLSRYALKLLLFVPYQLNSYLNSLDAAPNPYRTQARASHTSKQDSKHQHIPSRVWQRRSALITALEEQQTMNKVVVESAINVAPICEVQPQASEQTCSSCSFNVIQVRCLPVWASNFSDMGMIEQELDYFSQPELINKVV